MKTIGAILCALCVAAGAARAQTWTQVSPNTNYDWYGIAMSADGTKMAATVASSTGEGIYLSTNSGSTWTQSKTPSGYWGPIASSADGTRLLAANGNGDIYISADSGSTWNQTTAPAENWSHIASSANGTNLIAIYPASEGAGFIVISTNAGSSWLEPTNIGRWWSGITCSADGSKMAAEAFGDGQVPLVSTNYGLTWQPAASLISQGGYLASTADGSKLMLASSGTLDISTNWGATWSLAMEGSIYSWFACSANGSKLVGLGGDSADVSDDLVETSTNLGVSWETNDIPPSRYYFLACSADGNTLAAAMAEQPGSDESGRGIWISQTPPSPQLNVAFSNGSADFSWIIPSTNMVLEQSADLVNWVVLTNLPTLNSANLEDQISIPPTNAGAFFRLASQ
jgi:hypothetical protein